MSKTRRNFTHFLLLAVSAIGLLSALLLLADPPPQDLSTVSGLFGANPISSSSKRNIASIDPAQTIAPAVESALLEINCSQTEQHLQAAGPRFRLKGHLCAPENSNVLSTRVINKTNGYVATVFHQSTQFSTDYINLKEGRNEIKVEFETENGVVEKDVIIMRNVVTTAHK